MINVTDLNEYMFCPRKIYLQKIKGFRLRPTLPMIKGRLKHIIIEDFSKGEENLVSGIGSVLNSEQILELYRKNCFMLCQNVFSEHSNLVRGFRIEMDGFWKEFWGTFEEEILLRADAISDIISKGIFGADLWNNIEPKYESEMKIESERLGMRGRVDRVEVWKEKIVPCEIKNKISAQFYESDAIQLAAYAMLLEERFSKAIAKGVVQYKDKKLVVDIDGRIREKVKMIMNGINKLNEQPCPPISENFKKCNSCNLKEECFKFMG